MARDFHGHMWWEWRSPRFAIAQATIKRQKGFGARADDTQIGRAAACGARKIFRGVDQDATQASALLNGRNRKEAKIAALPAHLHIDAASQATCIFNEEELASVH